MNPITCPTASKRFGLALEVSPIPHKTCNWNCVYCHLGRSYPLTNLRKEYTLRRDLVSQVERTLDRHQSENLRWLVVSGQGEPTLHTGIGWMIRKIHQMSELPVVLVTNGAWLMHDEVRDELSAAEAVMPSLDAGTADVYRRINRPWPNLSFDRLLDGLVQFRQVFQGQLWLKVMLVKGLNDSYSNLMSLAKILEDIKPDQIHLLIPDRSPTLDWVQPPENEAVMRALAILGKVCQVIHPDGGKFHIMNGDNLEYCILRLLDHYPMRDEDLLLALRRWPSKEIRRALTLLLTSEKIQLTQRFGCRFWHL